MNLDRKKFIDLCTRYNLVDYIFDPSSGSCDDDDIFFERLDTEDGELEYYSYPGFNFYMAKYKKGKVYILTSLKPKKYTKIEPENFEYELRILSKKYKEIIIKDKIKELNKDFI